MPREEIDLVRVKQAAEQAQISSFIESSPRATQALLASGVFASAADNGSGSVSPGLCISMRGCWF